MPNLTDSPAQMVFFPLFEDENHNLSLGDRLVGGPSDEQLNLTSVPMAKNNITVLQQSSKLNFTSSSEEGEVHWLKRSSITLSAHPPSCPWKQPTISPSETSSAC